MSQNSPKIRSTRISKTGQNKERWNKTKQNSDLRLQLQVHNYIKTGETGLKQYTQFIPGYPRKLKSCCT